MNTLLLHNYFKSLGIIIAALLMVSDNVWAGRYFDSSEVLVAPTGSGTVYYVDGNNGNDSWNGRYATRQGGTDGPFKTIGKAIDRYSDRVVGGNTFKIKAGIYRERIDIGNVKGNESENTRFTIGSYGDGEVIIDTSDTQKLTWTPYSDDPKIYEALCTLTLSGHPASPDAIIMDDDFRKCRPVYSIAEVNAFGKWYFDKTSRKIYVYTNGTSPLLHDIIVTKHDPDNIEFGIYAVGINYLTIYGVTVRGAGAYEIYATGKKVRIEKCTLKFSGKGGIVADGDYNEFIKNHVWGNVLLNWPRGRTWNTSGGWPMGMVAKGSYSLMRGNISHDNGGEGIGTGSFPGFNIIEDNISYDNWSVNIYAGHQSDGTIRRNLVYCTGGEKNYALDADRLPLWSSLGKVYKRMRPEAIMIADEDYQSKVVSERNQIYNNIMIGCAKGFTYYGQAIGAGIKDVYIANNTIVLPDADNPEGVWVGIDIPYNKGNNRNTVIVNNIVYGVHSDQPLIWLKGGTNEKGIRLDNNLYFSRNYKTPFWSGDLITTKDDFPSWKNRYTQDMNNLYNDPIFKNTPAELTKGDYHLQPDSPAIGKGTNSVSSIVKEDFDLLSRSKNIPTIGAYESRN